MFFVFQVLVLGNKRDLPNALDEKQLIEKSKKLYTTHAGDDCPLLFE